MQPTGPYASTETKPVQRYMAPTPQEVHETTLDNSKKNNNNHSTTSLPGIGKRNGGSTVNIGDDLNKILNERFNEAHIDVEPEEDLENQESLSSS